jgi:hypothetical protein
MISFNRLEVLLLMWLTLSMNEFNNVAGIGKHHPKTVKVINDLGNGLPLTLGCKSKNDDLGVHTLKPNGFFEINFTPNFWGTTLFFCKFTWKNQVHWFKIYDYARDGDVCVNCTWKIRTTSACFLDPKRNEYDICYLWTDQNSPDRA